MGNVLDSNSFIEAKNVHYRFAVCPGYWDWLLRENAKGNVFSIDAIKDELTGAGDELSVWASARTDEFFRPRDGETVAVAGQITAWVYTRDYSPAAIAEFLDSADFWLVAYALAHGHTVITREVSAPDSKRRVKIPDVCLAVGVPFRTPFDLLSDLGAVFVLQ